MAISDSIIGFVDSSNNAVVDDYWMSSNGLCNVTTGTEFFFFYFSHKPQGAGVCSDSQVGGISSLISSTGLQENGTTAIQFVRALNTGNCPKYKTHY
jgi:hypothetical protein